MKAYTHLAFGFFSGLFLMDYVSFGNKYLFFVFVLFGAILPDIDTPNSKISHKIPVIPKVLNVFSKHRGIFHSVFIAILLGLFVSYFSKSYGIALFLGYTSHLLIDGLTKKGVNLLHPLSKLRISGPIETGKIWELVLLIVIVVGIVLSLMK
ncbi:metal-dependent hydrolase [Candidatus Woesearchaeota archaeon]|nr:metal-dependent hydrolase [Candidatus Woesearchaeota archaeon]